MNGPKVKIDGIPVAEPDQAVMHNNYCNDNIEEIEDSKKNEYPSNTEFHSKNLYVEESVKVLEQLILKADPLL